MATVGDRIKEIREKKGMTQEQLCRKAKVSKGFLSDVENGKRNISSQKLLEISNVLGASIDYLMKGELSENSGNASVTFPHDLSEAAEDYGWSYRETYELLAAESSIVARRSKKAKKELTKEEWKELFDTIKEVFG